MGYRTRTRSLTSSDAKKSAKRPKLPTLEESKTLMLDQLKSQVKQKSKSKSDGELFNEIEENNEPKTVQPTVKMQVDEDQLLSKIKDEIQAWVIPEVSVFHVVYSQVTKTGILSNLKERDFSQTPG